MPVVFSPSSSGRRSGTIARPEPDLSSEPVLVSGKARSMATAPRDRDVAVLAGGVWHRARWSASAQGWIRPDRFVLTGVKGWQEVEG